MKIFIDYGFSYLKAIDEKGNKVIFPSVSGELQTSGFSLSANGNGLGITLDGKGWLFGESALEQSTMAGRYQDTQWFLSEEYRAGILTAVTELTKASNVTVELMLGLPHIAWETMSYDIIKHLSGEYQVQRLGRNRQRVTITFFDKNGTFPQNFAPIFCHLISADGNMTLPKTRRREIDLAVFNGGSHTIEYSTIKLNLETFHITGVGAQSSTEEKGMYVLSGNVKRKIKSEFGRNIDDHEAFQIIQDGLLEMQNRDIDVSEVIKPYKEQYLNEMLKLASTVWGKDKKVEKDDLFAFIISGGQGSLLKPFFSQSHYHNNILMSDNPQWDVVEGMRRLRMLL